MICLIAVNEAFRELWKLLPRNLKCIGLSCQLLCLYCLLLVWCLPLIMTMKICKELSSAMFSVFLRYCLIVINTRPGVISPNQLSSHRKKCLKNNAGSEKNPRRSIIWLTGFLQLSRRRLGEAGATLRRSDLHLGMDNISRNSLALDLY